MPWHGIDRAGRIEPFGSRDLETALCGRSEPRSQVTRQFVHDRYQTRAVAPTDETFAFDVSELSKKSNGMGTSGRPWPLTVVPNSSSVGRAMGRRRWSQCLWGAGLGALMWGAPKPATAEPPRPIELPVLSGTPNAEQLVAEAQGSIPRSPAAPPNSGLDPLGDVPSPSCRAYAEATRSATGASLAYALYRVAWCELEPPGRAAADDAAALDHLARALEVRPLDDEDRERSLRLRPHLQRAFVLAYARARRPSHAWDDLGHDPSRMVSLARAYSAQGMALEAVITLRRLGHERPSDPKRCEWAARSVAAALLLTTGSVAAAEAVELGRHWSRLAEQSDSPEREQCHDVTESLLREVATTLHSSARRGEQASSFEAASRVFREYERWFADEPSAITMRYRHAELRLEQAHALYASPDIEVRRRALELYERVHADFIEVLAEDPTGPHHERAAYAQLQALRGAQEITIAAPRVHACKLDSMGICVYRARKRKKRKRTERQVPVSELGSSTPAPFTPREQSMLDAFDRFEQHVDVAAEYPREAPRILYRRAFLMLRRNRFESARPLLERLIQEHDGTRWAAWGALLLVDRLVVQWQASLKTGTDAKVRDDLEMWAERLLTMKLYKHREAARLRELLLTLLAGLSWRKAEDLQDQERFEECGEQFVAIFNRYEDHDRADTLLYNAARCFDAAYRVDSATKVRHALLARFPDSMHARETLHDLAQIYEALANYERSAERYEQFAQRYRKDEDTPAALERAYLIRKALDQPARARENLERYEVLFSRRDVKRAAAAFWDQIELLDDPNDVEAHARAYIERYGSKGGLDRRAIAHATLGRELWRKSCLRPNKDGSCVTIVHASSDAPSDGMCGERRLAKVRVGRRRAARAEEARRELARAVKLAERAMERSLEPQRERALLDALAMARFYAVQPAYEEFLRLDRSAHDPAPAHPHAHEDLHGAQLEDLKERYREVFSLGQSRWSADSAWQWSIAHERLGDHLRHAVPREHSSEEQRQAYCKRRSGPDEAIHEAATQALQFCVERAMQAQAFTPADRACEAELQRRLPKKYPPTYELFDKSRYTHAPMVSVGVQLEP